MEERETRKMFGFACTILLQGRSKEDNQEKGGNSDGKLGRETCGEKASVTDSKSIIWGMTETEGEMLLSFQECWMDLSTNCDRLTLGKIWSIAFYLSELTTFRTGSNIR
jgi:hypothetical protein